MADKEKKKLSLNNLDNAAEEKGSVWKTLWQVVKFMVVSGLVTIIQLILVNVLFYAMKGWTTPLPDFLHSIFNETTVGAGNENWGYVLPFFLSMLIANIYGYIQNKKTTFKSDAPKYCFVIYVIMMILLILFSTWLQGVIVHYWEITTIPFFQKIVGLAPTIASITAGFVMFLVMFPMEKFVLLKERKPAEEAETAE